MASLKSVRTVFFSIFFLLITFQAIYRSSNTRSDKVESDYSLSIRNRHEVTRHLRSVMSGQDEGLIANNESFIFDASSVPQEMLQYATMWRETSEDLLISSIYKGVFKDPNSMICSRKSNAIKLLILVTTTIEHFEKRAAVRMTWGHFSKREDVAFSFVIGNPPVENLSHGVVREFEKERYLYNDFIVADFQDSYSNLTLKTVHMLHWISIYCRGAMYFMKTDDDVFINVPRVVQLINDKKRAEEARKEFKIYGNIFSGHRPKRNESDRQHVPYNVYPKDLKFPDFTSGPAYLFSTKIVSKLLYTALKLPHLPLEDVLITGFAAGFLSIPRVHMTQFYNEMSNPIHLSPCDLQNMYAGMTFGTGKEMYYLWYTYLSSFKKCQRSASSELFSR